MKHFLLLTFMAVLYTFSACANDRIIQENQLPEAARTFIKTHFADQTIVKIEKDGFDYELDFANGWDVDFNSNGDWTDVNCEMDAVPASFLATLPAGIKTYVETNYPSCYIVEVSKGRKIEVELNNSMELVFSLNGEFLRIDR